MPSGLNKGKGKGEKIIISDYRNLTRSDTVQIFSGSAFQVAGPAWEKARSPNLVRSRDSETEDELRPEVLTEVLTVLKRMFMFFYVFMECDLLVLTDSTASVRYVGL